MALREILVELGIELDDAGAEKAIDNIRKGLKRMADEEKNSRKGLGGLSKAFGSVRNIAVGLGAVFLTGKIARGFASIIESAGDAAEVANKFGAVFQEETEGVGKALDNMAVATGQSKIAIREMGADAGALVKPLVGSNEAAGELARTMTSAALDIASFENVLPQEAMGAIRSAIIGSSEPMLRFGVDTRQAALAQYALDKGIGKSVKAMSTAEVTSLRMQLIMERLGTKGAIGDAAATANSFSNRLKALKGVIADASAEIGAEFLPAAQELLGTLISFVRGAIPQLIKGAKALLLVFRFLGNLVGGLLSPFERLDTALGAMGVVTLVALALGFQKVGVAATFAAIRAAAAWVLASLPLLLTVTLLGIIIGLVLLLIADFKAMGDGGDSVTGTMIQGFNDLVDELGGIGPAIWDMLKTALAFWIEFFGSTQDEAKEFVSVLDESLTNFWTDLIEGWKKIFTGFLDFITQGFRNVASFALDIVGADNLAKVVKGGVSLNGAGPTRSPATIPPPTVAGGGNISNNTSNSSVSVTVDASRTSDPEAVGREVAKQVDAVLDKRTRDLTHAFSVSGGT